LRERRFTNVSTISGHHITTVAPSTTSTTTASGGYYITVLDLSPLLVSAGKEAASSVTNVVLPIRIDEFMSSRSQPVAALHFSADGTSLAVIQRDGYVGNDGSKVENTKIKYIVIRLNFKVHPLTPYHPFTQVCTQAYHPLLLSALTLLLMKHLHPRSSLK